MSYPTLLEKIQMIDEDFKKSPLYNMSRMMPENKKEAEEWFGQVVDNANLFHERWNLTRKEKDGKPLSPIDAFNGDYAKAFAYYTLHDYVNAIERKYKERFNND